MTETTDKLVREATAGLPGAVDALLERYLPGLRAFLRLRAGPMVLQRESCSDLAQSVCRDVLQHIDRFHYDGEIGFRRWLYTTALRKIADRKEYWLAQKRDALREVRPASGDGEEEDLLACCAHLCTPSHDAAMREELERVQAAIRRLPPDYQEVLILDKVMGLSRPEIAAQLGKSESAVKTLVFRALCRLGEMVERDDE